MQNENLENQNQNPNLNPNKSDPVKANPSRNNTEEFNSDDEIDAAGLDDNDEVNLDSGAEDQQLAGNNKPTSTPNTQNQQGQKQQPQKDQPQAKSGNSMNQNKNPSADGSKRQ
jgi:hypothetical protein